MRDKNEYFGLLQQEQYNIVYHRTTHALLLANFLKKHYLSPTTYDYRTHQYIDFTKALVSQLETFTGEVADLVKMIREQLLLLNVTSVDDNLFSILSAYFTVSANQSRFLISPEMTSPQVEQIRKLIKPNEKGCYSETYFSNLPNQLANSCHFSYSSENLLEGIENLLRSGLANYIPSSYIENAHSTLWSMHNDIRKKIHHEFSSNERINENLYGDVRTQLGILKLAHQNMSEMSRAKIVNTLLWILDQSTRAENNSNSYALLAMETLASLGDVIPEYQQVSVVKKMLATYRLKQFSNIALQAWGISSESRQALSYLSNLPKSMLSLAKKQIKEFLHQALHSKHKDDWQIAFLFDAEFVAKTDRPLLKSFILNSLNKSTEEQYIITLFYINKVKNIFTADELNMLLENFISIGKMNSTYFMSLLQVKNLFSPEQRKRVAAKINSTDNLHGLDWHTIAQAYFECDQPQPKYYDCVSRLINLIQIQSLSGAGFFQTISVKPVFDALNELLPLLTFDELNYLITFHLSINSYSTDPYKSYTLPKIDYSAAVKLLLYKQYQACISSPSLTPTMQVVETSSESISIFKLIDSADLNGTLSEDEKIIYDELTCPITLSLVREPVVVVEEIISEITNQRISFSFVFEKTAILDALERSPCNPKTQKPLDPRDCQTSEAIQTKLENFIQQFAKRRNIVLNGHFVVKETVSSMSVFPRINSSNALQTFVNPTLTQAGNDQPRNVGP